MCVCVLFVFHCDIGLVYYLVAVVFVFMLIYFCKWVKLNKFTKRGRGDEQMNKGWPFSKRAYAQVGGY